MLFSSEKCPSTNGKDLKDIFFNRFKLPDGFWSDLFNTNCPEGKLPILSGSFINDLYSILLFLYYSSMIKFVV